MIDNKKYIENLKSLDFQIEKSGCSSVYLVEKQFEYIAKEESPYIIIALDKAKEFGADAVYFRLFDDERPPLAQIYVYDNVLKKRKKDDFAKIHRAVWSGCEIPVYMIIDKTEIKVFDGRKPVDIVNNEIKTDPIDTIELTGQAVHNDVFKKYRAQLFNNGTFWENENTKKHFLNSKIASERLLKRLKKIRNALRKDNSLNIKLIDKLLIICILIKYLEETGFDKKDSKNYAHDFFKKATGFENLENIILNNKLNCLLTALSEHFNGGIFKIDDKFKHELNNTDISSFASFFEAGYKDNLFGWKEYSFEHIPVELISNIYEEFISKTSANEHNKKDTGAVYTPSFLVELLIDECLPLDEFNENVKLIDPACGSGIFLVTAYKRLVQRWRIKNITQNKLANTHPEILKSILTNNIFGVDINPTSANLSIFSLHLALCSMLTPKQIWTELEFADLEKNKNIIRKDFFKYLIDENTIPNFDLVIGNPPFIQKELDGRSYGYYNDLLKDKFPIKFENPNKEFAFLFLEKSMHLLDNKKGKLCLILPSGHLLYTEDSICLKKSLFTTYNVSQIIDFTFLRRVLFQSTIASLAIFVDCKPPNDMQILHITAKRTKQSKERLYFEFDHYDFYQIPKELVSDKINVWKCNLLGGYRVCDIIEKFNKIKTKVTDFYKKLDIKKQDHVKKEDVFSEKRTLKNEKSLFNDEKITHTKNNKYWSIRKSIKGVFPDEITVDDFKKKDIIDAIGFKGSTESIEQFKNYIKKYSQLLCFYITAVSGRQGIRGPYTIYLSDFKNFPYHDNLINYLTASDKIIIDDVIKYTIDEFGKGESSRINISTASYQDLIIFSEIYCNAINSIYQSDNKKYRLINITEGDAYFICEMQFTDNVSKPKITKTNASLNELLFEEEESPRKKINRIVRFYKSDVIQIIKPKQLRFWLKSKALRDADETFDDILKN